MRSKFHLKKINPGLAAHPNTNPLLASKTPFSAQKRVFNDH